MSRADPPSEPKVIPQLDSAPIGNHHSDMQFSDSMPVPTTPPFKRWWVEEASEEHWNAHSGPFNFSTRPYKSLEKVGKWNKETQSTRGGSTPSFTAAHDDKSAQTLRNQTTNQLNEKGDKNPLRESNEVDEEKVTSLGRFSDCRKYMHLSPPPSRVPSLCGSSIPSQNTTPHMAPAASVGISDSLLVSYSTAPACGLEGNDDALKRFHLWLYGKQPQDGALSSRLKNETFGSHDDEDSISGTSFQDGDDSLGASASNSEAWSETSSNDEDALLSPQIRQYLPLAVDILYKYFLHWKSQAGSRARTDGQGSQRNCEGGASSQAPTTPSSNPLTQTVFCKGSGKRRVDDGDRDPPLKKRKLDRCSEEQNLRLLACPFAKKNPLQHRKCFKYVLQEIARLKQHLLRVHQAPIQCARCSDVFDTVEDRDYHSRQPECIVRPPRAFEGINESQKRQLGKRISSKKSREENWYLIYQILFPDADRPDSPYIEDMRLSEELLAMREFASQMAPARITQFTNSMLPPELRSNQQQIELFVQAAVRDVFDRVLEGWENSQSNQSSAGTTPPSSTPRSNHDSGYSTPPTTSTNPNGVSRAYHDEPVPSFVADPLPPSPSLFDQFDFETFLIAEHEQTSLDKIISS